MRVYLFLSLSLSLSLNIRIYVYIQAHSLGAMKKKAFSLSVCVLISVLSYRSLSLLVSEWKKRPYVAFTWHFIFRVSL